MLGGPLTKASRAGDWAGGCNNLLVCRAEIRKPPKIEDAAYGNSYLFNVLNVAAFRVLKWFIVLCILSALYSKRR